MVTMLLATTVAAYGIEPASQGQPLSSPLTLAECYRLALARSETLAQHEALLAATEAKFVRARSGILPRAALVSQDTWQDGTGSSAFTQRHVPLRYLEASQPLFSGFKEFAAMRNLRAEHVQREADRRRAEHLLLLDVVDAFYGLLSARAEIASGEAIRAVLVDQQAEIEERVRLGRSPASDLSVIEAERLTTEASLGAAEGQEEIARHLLEFLTGRSSVTALVDETGAPATTLAPAGPIQRPDVEAAEAALDAAQHAVTVAKAGRWPTVTADGAYYLERGGAAREVTWDATLTVRVPIFQGGEVTGDIREAEAGARHTELAADATRRRATYDLKDATTLLNTALLQHVRLAQALIAAATREHLAAQDRARARISLLDWLQSLKALETTRRDAIQSTFDVQRTSWQLRVARGEGF